jgi:hypothetical protein
MKYMPASKPEGLMFSGFTCAADLQQRRNMQKKGSAGNHACTVQGKFFGK